MVVCRGFACDACAACPALTRFCAVPISRHAQATVGIHRTRANVETAPLLHKLEYHHGVFVPPASYFDSTPLPPEWLQALPHLNRPPSPIRSPPLLDRPSTASPAWPARSPSPGVRDGTRNPHGGFGETKDSRPAVTTGRGTAGGGGGGDDGASSGYSDYSDVFEDDAKSPQRSARHASPAAITSPPLHPPTRPAFGTVWQVRVQVHAIHGLRTQPEQTCRVVCEIFEEVMSNESLPVGRSAVARTSRRDQAVGDASSGNGASPGHSLNDSTSTFPLGSSVGSASVDILASLGFAVRRKAPGSTVGSKRGGPDAGPVQPETEATMFVFNSTSTQRLLARATDLRTFLKQAHSLLMEIIVSTPPPAKPSKVSLLRVHGSPPPHSNHRCSSCMSPQKHTAASPGAGSTAWDPDTLDGGASDSSEDEPTLQRYMCQVSLEPLQSKTVVDGAFQVCRTNGEPVRFCVGCGGPHVQSWRR